MANHHYWVCNNSVHVLDLYVYYGILNPTHETLQWSLSAMLSSNFLKASPCTGHVKGIFTE